MATAARIAADEAERLRTMPPDLVELRAWVGLFRMAMPASLGGLEMDPLGIVTAIERSPRRRLGGMDGPDRQLDRLLRVARAARSEGDVRRSHRRGVDEHVRSAGQARRDGHHLVIDGRWPFNSGCVHADWYQTGIIVHGRRPTGRRPDGTPDLRFAYFPAAAAEIHDTWHATGLRGTGSHDVEVRQLRIPAEHSAAPMLDPARDDGPLWQLGFFPLLSVLMPASRSVSPDVPSTS